MQKRVNRKNALLADGVRRFKKGKIAARKEHFSLKSLKMVRTKKPKVVKKISGAKNVGEYKVLVKKYISYLPTKSMIQTCTEEELFAEKEVKYVPSEQRKADQKFLDEEVLKAIKAHPEDKKTCTEEELFAEKEVKYVPSEQRKADQKFLDEEVLKAIKAHPEDKVIRRYLKTMFSMPT
ncbi:hypothetical protein quinque_007330 [Culex quinquefasciatus]